MHRLISQMLGDRSHWRTLIASMPAARPILLRVAVGSVLRTALMVPVPLIVRELFDGPLPEGDLVITSLLGLGMLACYVGGTAIDVWVRGVALELTTATIVNLRERLRDVVAWAPLEDLRQRGHAELYDTVATNVIRVDNLLFALVSATFPAILLGLGLSVLLLVIDWRLVLASLAFVPLSVLASHFLGDQARALWTRHHHAFMRYTDLALRANRLAPLIRASGADDLERRRHREAVQDVGSGLRRARFFSIAYAATLQSIMVLASVGILVCGAALLAYDQITIGRMIAFFAGFALLREPIQHMIQTIPALAEGRPALAIVNRLLELETAGAVAPVGGREIVLRGHVELRGVAFAYPGEAPLFTDLNLELQPGTVTALVGANGIGKSTLVSLVLGLRQPSAGTILADGVAYDQLDLEHLRRQMAVVFQELMLDEGPIAGIIGYGLDQVAGEQVRHAAELADAHGFIERLPRGYDTIVGRQGIELSLGQHQRLSIARALARRPAVLILDEPTNHLDPAAVQHVLATLRRLDQLPATLVVSHHHEVVEWADRVVELLGAGGSPDQPALRIAR